MTLTIEQEERIENAKEALAAGELDTDCCLTCAINEMVAKELGEDYIEI